MSTRVTLTWGQSGVVAVKTAATPDHIADLAGEATRLQQAIHPGVVRLVEHRVVEGRAELRTQFAGEPLDRWRGNLVRTAGLVTAVAATIADLHDIGLVHGRLDESHVLVGSDGRPRLCSFSSNAEESSPPDDVAAIGHILDVLVERAVEIDGRGRGSFLWPRAQAAQQRALSELVTHATDPVATRRPTARALARSILAALPEAELPPRTNLDRRPGRTPDRPSSDREWVVSAANLRRAPRDSEHAGEPEDSADPDGNGDGLFDGTLDDPKGRDVDPFGRDNDPFDQDLGAGVATAIDVSAVTPGLEDPNEFDEPGGLDLTISEVFGDQTTARLDDLFVDRPWHSPDDACSAPTERTSDHPIPESRPALRRRPDHDPSRRKVRRVAAAGAVGLAVVAAGGLALRLGAPGDVGAQSPALASSPATGRACAPTDRGGSSAPHGQFSVDIDGDGCPDTVQVTGGVVHVAGQRWSVGEPDDAVAVGDWDCDGVATPVVYRPSTGDVFVFSGWAATGQPLAAEAVAQIGGGTALTTATPEPGQTGCDQVAIELVTGGRHVVEVEP